MLTVPPRANKVPAREREARHLTIFAARHASGRISVTVAELDRKAALQRVMDEGVVPHDADIAPPVEHTHALHGLRTTLLGTHQRVSRRWTERYVTGWAALQGSDDRFASVMHAAMACPPRPWCHLRPTDLRQARTYP